MSVNVNELLDDEFTCQLSGEVLTNPVIVVMGTNAAGEAITQTLDRAFIEELIDRKNREMKADAVHNEANPFNREKLEKEDLKPDIKMMEKLREALIEKYKSATDRPTKNALKETFKAVDTNLKKAQEEQKKIAEAEAALAQKEEKVKTFHKIVKKGSAEEVMQSLRSATVRGKLNEPISSKHGYVPLHHAAARLDASTVRKMIEKGADPSIQAEKGYTAAHIAALKGQLENVDALIKSPKEANKADRLAHQLATVKIDDFRKLFSDSDAATQARAENLIEQQGKRMPGMQAVVPPKGCVVVTPLEIAEIRNPSFSKQMKADLESMKVKASDTGGELDLTLTTKPGA